MRLTINHTYRIPAQQILRIYTICRGGAQIINLLMPIKTSATYFSQNTNITAFRHPLTLIKNCTKHSKQLPRKDPIQICSLLTQTEKIRRKCSFFITHLFLSSLHAMNVISTFCVTFQGLRLRNRTAFGWEAQPWNRLASLASVPEQSVVGHSLAAGEPWLCGICRIHQGSAYCVIWEYGFRHS